MAQFQNLTTHILARSTPHGDPWIGNILEYDNGDTPLTAYNPPADNYVQVTRITITTDDSFSVPLDGIIRIFWGDELYERIEFNDSTELKGQATAVQASGVYAFEFYPHKGLNPIYIKYSESDTISVGCYSSGGTLQEAAAIASPIQFSFVGVIEDESYIA